MVSRCLLSLACHVMILIVVLYLALLLMMSLEIKVLMFKLESGNYITK